MRNFGLWDSPDQTFPTNLRYKLIMEQGWDPQVSRFFARIINALAWTLIWMVSAATIGFYIGLAFPEKFPLWACLLYYLGVAVAFFGLILYLKKLRGLK